MGRRVAEFVEASKGTHNPDISDMLPPCRDLPALGSCKEGSQSRGRLPLFPWLISPLVSHPTAVAALQMES